MALRTHQTRVRGNAILGDITRFFETGHVFSNLSASRGRSFCDSSNRLLGSLLVIFLRDRRWPVGACILSYSTGKTNSVNEHFRFTSCRNCPPHVRATRWFSSQCLQSCARAAPGLAHYYIQGAVSDATSDLVGKNRAKQDVTWTSDCLTFLPVSCNNLFNSLHLYEGVSPYSNVDNTRCLGKVSSIFLLVFLLASLKSGSLKRSKNDIIPCHVNKSLHISYTCIQR